MAKLLVHLHIYYHDQTDYFIEKMANIGTRHEWDLAVTLCERNPVTEQKLKRFKPDAEFILVENFGYDVWPFIRVIRQKNIDCYDYVLKLHTKHPVTRKVNKITMHGYQWRDRMVDALLESPERFERSLGVLESDPSAGVIYSLYACRWSNRCRKGMRLYNEFVRLGMMPADMRFCAGTIFMARAEIYKILQSDKIEAGMFNDSVPVSDSDMTMAHIYERVLTMLPSALGWHVVTVCDSLPVRAYICAGTAATRILEWIFSLTRYGEDKAKILTLFGFRFRIG